MSKLIFLTINIIFLTFISCQSKSENDNLYATGNSTNTESEKASSTDILLNIDTTQIKIVQLPRPNSGAYSYDEAEKRKGEIYDMQLTSKYFEWNNPTTGGAVHINQQDEIEVYQSTMSFFGPNDTSFVVKKEELTHYVGGIGSGNPASVLITSEYDLNKSKSIDVILAELFEPGTQLYYLKKN